LRTRVGRCRHGRCSPAPERVIGQDDPELRRLTPLNIPTIQARRERSTERDRERPAHLRDDSALWHAEAWPDPEARHDARSSHPGRIIDKAAV
jgi:hypothetical protein